MITRRPLDEAGPYRSAVTAVVKWYNPTKGFGFVKPNDGSPDAFLHASRVAEVGHQDLAEGSTLVCDIAEGPRGPQVAAIHSVEEPTEPVARGRPRHLGGGGDVVEGTVKFFNAEKGFGFIVPDDGSKDVFVSARMLTRSGITLLEAEQRVRVTTRMGQKGPMAARLELL